VQYDNFFLHADTVPSCYDMCMLSVFPELLFLAPFSAFVIRVSIACLFALAAYSHARATPSIFIYILAALEILAALSLAIGYYAQMGALFGILVVGVWFIVRTTRPYSLSTALLMLVMSLSILVTGPGALAFDLPL
jgi:uncharacterized membrane protein YphA (DoxX/SURF4 family)